MEKTQPPEKQTNYGVRLADLTQEMVEDIFRIYAEVAGVKFEENLDQMARGRYDRDYVEATIKEGFPVDLRLGSKLTGHSKLFIERGYAPGESDVLKVRFSDNLVKTDGEERLLEGEKMRLDFQGRINDYLQSKGVAVPLGY